MLERPTCLFQLSFLEQEGSRRPEKEGQVKGKAAVSPAHPLNKTPKTADGPVGLYTEAMGADTDTLCQYTIQYYTILYSTCRSTCV